MATMACMEWPLVVVAGFYGRWMETEGRGQRTEDRGQWSVVGGRESVVGSRESGGRYRNPETDASRHPGLRAGIHATLKF